MQQAIEERKAGRILAAIFAVWLCWCAGGMGEAKAARTVKVAFFPMAGFHEYARDGSHIGMDVEYLSAISEHTGWEIRYVDCDSWEEALEMVRNGTAQYSAERARIFRYADFPSGYTFGAVMVDGESAYAYEDFDVMRDLTDFFVLERVCALLCRQLDRYSRRS